MKVVGIFCFLMSLGGSAWASSEFVPIQERAEGQSLTGASLMNDSVYSNPASSSFQQVYSLEGSYDMPRNFSASILDTRTSGSGMGAGLGYFRETLDNTTDVLQGARLAVSGKANEIIGVGLAGKMLWGPNGARGGDLDGGLLVNLDSLQLGATLRNLMQNVRSLGLNRELAIGARLGWKDTLYVSATGIAPVESMKPDQFGVGLEYDSPFYIGVKGGYRIVSDATLPGSTTAVTATYWDAGLSLNTPKICIHYAIEFPNQVPKTPGQMISTTILF